jgi:hypothetical protein
MTRTAIINGGIVENVILTGDGWTAPEGVTAVDCGPEVGPGWTYDGDGFTAPPTPPAPRRLLAKSTVQERVNAIGKLDEVMTVLNSQPIYFARWFAPDWPNVYFDDEGLLAILAAVGCTEAEIETITAP